ncbi:MAG: bifunctional phosphoribosylaminoimidazolecarboxamide formyltransferase/IMP cyclohydrolase [Flavobacteriaceae bacterium]|nr:bifunctional phosphoribosylaminoimidazolecarboxamide formyltransferase/IMP cyclohydrolase [Flavobacteriaceae bacterium]
MSTEFRKIKRALLSVYDKTGLEPVVRALDSLGIECYSTGGTYKYIKDLGIKVNSIEGLTSYPSILGGRVKTLHPKVFGGILARSDDISDAEDLKKYQIQSFDLVVVNLYPFEQTLSNSNATHSQLIEKIDIGGVSLIRAAAKNYSDILCISHRNQYLKLVHVLDSNSGGTYLQERATFAADAFLETQNYDGLIAGYLGSNKNVHFKEVKTLRYGENPHQKAVFEGNLKESIEQLHGKEISYNNLLDIESAILLSLEFDSASKLFAIFKHNNACGVGIGDTLADSFQKALQADPISAFGGVFITNQILDLTTAQAIRPIFIEVIIAKDYHPEALDLLKKKRNLIILKSKITAFPKVQFRSCLNGTLRQDFDFKTDDEKDLKVVTTKKPSSTQINELIFASILCKHTKSNAVVLSKNKQLLASGMGQTSRIDALKQAIDKADKHNLNLEGSVMASEAFFPFPDCVELAYKHGIKAVIQPGKSKNDQLSIDYCNENGISMVFTGFRHFKH